MAPTSPFGLLMASNTVAVYLSSLPNINKSWLIFSQCLEVNGFPIMVTPFEIPLGDFAGTVVERHLSTTPDFKCC